MDIFQTQQCCLSCRRVQELCERGKRDTVSVQNVDLHVAACSRICHA